MGLALLAFATGVLSNYESWLGGADNYDLWSLYIRWLLVACPLGIACANFFPACTLLYVVPSAALRIAHLARAQFAESNLMPMMLIFELIAAATAAILMIVGGMVGRRLFRGPRTDLSGVQQTRDTR